MFLSAATPPPDAGVLIYSRPVFKAAEVRGEPATPNQVELTAAIPWQGSLRRRPGLPWIYSASNKFHQQF